MKVIITGCARSGTTMLTHLMRYFYSTNVIVEDEAHPFDYGDYNHKDHVLVIKKPFLQSNHIEYFSLQELLVSGWRVIWMLRDGRDVICSKQDGNNFHVEPERWIEANQRFLELYNSRQVMAIRYSELVRKTYQQMLRISDFINQDFQRDFDLWWQQVDTTDPMNVGIKPRPISAQSIGNYRNYPDRVAAVLQNYEFKKLLNIFGYVD